MISASECAQQPFGRIFVGSFMAGSTSKLVVRLTMKQLRVRRAQRSWCEKISSPWLPAANQYNSDDQQGNADRKQFSLFTQTSPGTAFRFALRATSTSRDRAQRAIAFVRTTTANPLLIWAHVTVEHIGFRFVQIFVQLKYLLWTNVMDLSGRPLSKPTLINHHGMHEPGQHAAARLQSSCK